MTGSLVWEQEEGWAGLVWELPARWSASTGDPSQGCTSAGCLSVDIYSLRVEYVYSKVLFELWRKRWTNINLCWPRLASGWPGFHAALGWRSLWKEIDHNKKNYDVDTIAQALNSPHVDGGNGDSGTDADPSDRSSDVQVVETGRSPYQQPAPNLRNKELKRMPISCKYAYAKVAWSWSYFARAYPRW